MMANKYVEFIEEGEIYKIRNKIYDQIVGEIRKERIGTWMHWQLFLYPDCGCSNGCLREIIPFITSLYSKKNVGERLNPTKQKTSYLKYGKP